MSRLIFHVDVNSAYLSWEAAYRLQHGGKVDLRNIPSLFVINLTISEEYLILKELKTFYDV